MMMERGARKGAGAEVRPRHIPVLLPQILDALAPIPGGAFIDGTFGAGGYTRAILDAGAAHVLAIDRDPAAVAAGASLRTDFADRLQVAHGRFGALDAVAQDHGLDLVDGVVLDIGVSSMQLDQAERGFSFQASGPLDMRMSSDGVSAADIVNAYGEKQIADILYQLGEEKRSRAIARAIVKAREAGPILTTEALADIVVRVLGRRHDELHPATRTFQALRIFVNDELGELALGLVAAERVLKPGGRLVVVTFHSLEDRIVKRFFTLRGGRSPAPSRHLPAGKLELSSPSFQIVNQRPLTSSLDEIAANPRARSARLRAAVRTSAPVWPAVDLVELSVPQPVSPR